MSRTLDFDKRRQFYLDLHLQRVMKFEPERTGPSNRSHYMACSLGEVIQGYLLGLRDRVLPTAQALVAWMEGQAAPPRGQG